MNSLPEFPILSSRFQHNLQSTSLRRSVHPQQQNLCSSNPSLPLERSSIFGAQETARRPFFTTRSLASSLRRSSTGSPLSQSRSSSSDTRRMPTTNPRRRSFVDLTDEQQPSDPPGARMEAALTASSGSAQPSAKKRKTSKSPSLKKEIDVSDVESDSELAEILEKQRAATVHAQFEASEKTTQLSSITCVVCMEEMTNVTATHCGHLFCHTCLMEALIAGENQGLEPGKGQSKCPICRKKVKRPKGKTDMTQVIPLEIMIKSKGRRTVEESSPRRLPTKTS